MKIAVLTSSRADFGIYLPLLKAMHSDAYFDVRLIVFGTHLSSFHGKTIKYIQAENFKIDECIENIFASDTAASIATSMAVTTMKFAQLWEKNRYDLVFCLGDRYEMFSAVSAAIPYGVRFAHIHGGETTLGAIDNQFRHSLSIFSELHFVSTPSYSKRVEEIIGSNKDIYTVGALSLETLQYVKLLSTTAFKERFNIDMEQPTLLVTYHPETVANESNERNAKELIHALQKFPEYQIVITMPNADTSGNVMRQIYESYKQDNQRVILVENFGTLGYFSCIKHSKLVIGNSSSGIIEAASFQKYVVDIGDRQKGRATSGNIIHASNDSRSIEGAILQGLSKGDFTGTNIYDKGGASKKIIEVIKQWNSKKNTTGI